MDTDLRLVRAFVAVAMEGNFTRAASRVKVTQPTLTLQIQRLEEQLGFPLFRRTTRRVSLTREGEQLLKPCQEIIATLDSLRLDVRRLREQKQRELHVGTAFFTVDVAERNALLEAFSDARPDIKMTIHNASQADLIAAVGRGTLDCAIVLGGAQANYFNNIHGQTNEGLYPVEWRVASLGTRRIGLLAPCESALARLPSISIEDLRGVEVAMIDPSQGDSLLEPLNALLAAGGVRIVYPFESRNAPAVERFGVRRRMVCVSLGWFDRGAVAVDNSMVWRPIEAFTAETDLAVIARPEQRGPITEAFVQFSRTRSTGFK